MRPATTYHALRNGQHIATIAEARYEGRSGWYWYGDGTGTVGACNLKPLSKVKAAVTAYFKAL